MVVIAIVKLVHIGTRYVEIIAIWVATPMFGGGHHGPKEEKMKESCRVFACFQTQVFLALALLATVAAACDPQDGDGKDVQGTGDARLADLQTEDGQDLADHQDSNSSFPPCNEVDEPVKIAACMTPSDTPPPEVIYQVDYAAQGIVVEVGSGMPPDNCFHSCQHLGQCTDEATVSLEAHWVKFQDDEGKYWTAAFSAPAQIPWLDVGDSVAASYSWTEEPFAPDFGLFQVHKDHELVLWMTTTGAPHALAGPEGLVFDKGEQICADSEECGAWGAFTLKVTKGAETGYAAYRTSPPLSIGGFQVLNAALISQTTFEVTCLDWFVSDSRIVVWPYSALP